MAGIGMHYRTRYKSELSPRQREVIDLVARGYTNGQIAEALGMSLDGAKWHVSEILAKLDFDTREEAGRYWRAEHALPRRLARAMPGWLGLKPLLIAAGTVAAVAVGVGVSIALRAATTNTETGTSAQASLTVPATATPPAFDYGTAVENPTFQSVHMVTADAGWAISNTPAGGSVLRTADGGGHWRNVSPPGVASASGASAIPLGTGFFLDAEHGWVEATDTSTPGVPGPTTVWRTSDGGKTWQASEPISGGIRGTLSFTDDTHGWYLQGLGAGAGSEGVAIYRTTDGGVHWSQATVTSNTGNSELPLSCSKSGITFVDANRGWVTGECMGGSPFVYVTGDGGATWSPVSLPDPTNPSESLEDGPWRFQPPQFLDSQHGLMAAWTGAEAIYVTADGGATWDVVGGPPVENALVTYAFADATHWFAATNGGNTLYGTSDGGKTWSVIATPPQFGTGLGELQFADPEHGWALAWSSGENPQMTLVRTSDGGKTWRPMHN